MSIESDNRLADDANDEYAAYVAGQPSPCFKGTLYRPDGMVDVCVANTRASLAFVRDGYLTHVIVGNFDAVADQLEPQADDPRNFRSRLCVHYNKTDYYFRPTRGETLIGVAEVDGDAVLQLVAAGDELGLFLRRRGKDTLLYPLGLAATFQKYHIRKTAPDPEPAKRTPPRVAPEAVLETLTRAFAELQVMAECLPRVMMPQKAGHQRRVLQGKTALPGVVAGLLKVIVAGANNCRLRASELLKRIKAVDPTCTLTVRQLSHGIKLLATTGTCLFGPRLRGARMIDLNLKGLTNPESAQFKKLCKETQVELPTPSAETSQQDDAPQATPEPATTTDASEQPPSPTPTTHANLHACVPTPTLTNDEIPTANTPANLHACDPLEHICDATPTILHACKPPAARDVEVEAPKQRPPPNRVYNPHEKIADAKVEPPKRRPPPTFADLDLAKFTRRQEPAVSAGKPDEPKTSGVIDRHAELSAAEIAADGLRAAAAIRARCQPTQHGPLLPPLPPNTDPTTYVGFAVLVIACLLFAEGIELHAVPAAVGELLKLSDEAMQAEDLRAEAMAERDAEAQPGTQSDSQATEDQDASPATQTLASNARSPVATDAADARDAAEELRVATGARDAAAAQADDPQVPTDAGESVATDDQADDRRVATDADETVAADDPDAPRVATDAQLLAVLAALPTTTTTSRQRRMQRPIEARSVSMQADTATLLADFPTTPRSSAPPILGWHELTLPSEDRRTAIGTLGPRGPPRHASGIARVGTPRA